MNIKCENCGAIYELDDDKIPPEGLAVQCSECGTIFVARKNKPKPTTVQPVVLQKKPQTAPRYKLRRPSGKVYPFRDMATLHRWIVERKASPMDEMTEDGVNWTKLEDIPELEPFFKAVAALKQGTGAFRKSAEQNVEIDNSYELERDTEVKPVRLDHVVSHGVHASPTVQLQSVQEQPQPRTTLIGTGVPDPNAQNLQNVSQQQVPPQSTQPVQTTTQQQMPQVPQQTFGGAPTQQNIPQQPSGPTTWQDSSATQQQIQAVSAAKTGEEDDFWEEYERLQGGTWKKWVVILLLLVVGGLAAWYFADQKSFKSTFSFVFGEEVPPLAVEQLSKAKQKIFKGDEQSIIDGITSAASAIQLAPEYPVGYAIKAQLQASLSMLYLAHIEWMNKRIQKLNGRIESTSDENAKKALVGQINDYVARVKAEEVKRKDMFVQARESANSAYQFSGAEIGKEPETVLALAFVASAGKDTNDANKYFQQLEAQKSVSIAARAAFARGVLLLFSDDAEQMANAIRNLSIAIEKEPSFVASYYYMALAYLLQNNADKAKEMLKKLTNKNPSHAMAKELLGIVESDTAQKETAKQEEAPAPKIAPPPPEKKKAKKSVKLGFSELLRKSRRLRNSDRPEAAIKYARKALDMQPDNPKAMIEVGWCLIDLERTREARKLFFKAYKIAPSNHDAVLGIAISFDVSGEVSRAVKWYKKFLNLCPACEDAPAARQYINQHEDEE